MLKIFKRKSEQVLKSTDERKILIDSYLRDTADKCFNYEYSRGNYVCGGLDSLKNLIDDLIEIKDRIVELENEELIEKRNFYKETVNSIEKGEGLL